MTVQRTRHVVFVVAGVAALGFIAMLFLQPVAAAGGWLIAFLLWGGISVGSLVWIMIHHLTGGRWGIFYGQIFWRSATNILLLALILVPILILASRFYPALGEATAVKPDVSQFYLNTPAFIARSAVVVLGWTVILFALAWCGRQTAIVVAALGLVFHGLIIGLVGLDWIQSIHPPFFLTSFGACFAVTQMMSALAWAALTQSAQDENEAVSDLGGLTLSTVLGLTYLTFMAYLIEWYGDIPVKVEWFVAREAYPWIALAAGAFILIIVIPTIALLFARVRGDSVALRLVGAVILIGVILQYAWLIGPAFGSMSLLASALAVLAVGGAFVAAGTAWPPIRPEPARSAHVE